jgi:type II secretory pathway component PulK
MGNRSNVRGTRSGVILIVVLVMVTLLALLAASYAFMVQAHISAAIANHQRFQARMAAESGIQRVMVMFQKGADDPDYSEGLNRWYDNPKAFQGGLVYGTEGESNVNQRREEDTTYDPNAKAAWRYNLVAPNYDEPGTLRYGVTDECSKLDLNKATQAQLQKLLEIIPDDPERTVDRVVLLESLLDWREAGTTARSSGAKDEYYQSLTPPYKCAKGDFSTVEELLLVRGFTSWVLFGEDYNRNGLLDTNEDDGDATFPPDNSDGLLFPGIAPFLTVSSREWDIANDGKPRINIKLEDPEKLVKKLEEAGLDGNVISYIKSARDQKKQFTSVMDLFDPPPYVEEQTDQQAASSQPAATTQKSGTRQPPSSQPQSSQPTSSSAGENAAGQGEGSSDLDQSADAAAKAPEYKQKEYPDQLPGEKHPGTDANLPLILDRLTVASTPYTGRINVCTAPRAVLATIPHLSTAEVDAIIAARRQLSGDEKVTPAWLQKVLGPRKFRDLLDGNYTDLPAGGIITAKSSVYHVESLGYADHVGVVERLDVVFEMRGPIPQVLYQRNLTGLGPAYNPHGIDRRGMMNRSK